jgi:two-component system, NarL family, sensor histidine kinase DesK
VSTSAPPLSTLSDVTEPPASKLQVGLPLPWMQRRSVLGPWVACFWLIFLGPAIVDGWRDRHSLSGLVAVLSTLAFMVLYAIVFLGARRSRMRLLTQPPLRWALVYVSALTGLGTVSVVTTGVDGLATSVFIAVAAVMTLPLALALPLATVLVILDIVIGTTKDWNTGGIAFGTVMASLAIFGMRTVMARNIQLWRAHEENTLLAVDNERNRFARDLHDILGHSLTVITVKAELAQRLIDADPQRARSEIADLERLSRDALADVRRAVEGYRDLTLPGELARARAALRTAEIEPHLPQSTDAVPSELRELFAWTVREGVTNVIRHSGARRCEIVLTGSSAEIRDNGCGPLPGTAGDGSGLAGLRERAAAVGAVVTTRCLEPGFSLRVEAAA